MIGLTLVLAAVVLPNESQYNACRAGTMHTVETAHADSLVATLSFENDLSKTRSPCGPIRDLRIRIVRAGRLVYEGAPSDVAWGIDNVEGFDIQRATLGAQPKVRFGFWFGSNEYVIDYLLDSSRRMYSPSFRTADSREPLFGAADIHADGSAGSLTFSIKYQKDDFWVVGTPRVAIRRAGFGVYDGPLVPSDVGIDADLSPMVLDLDADGDSEVLFDLAERGTNCCARTEVFWYDPQRAAFARTGQRWGYYRDMPRLETEPITSRTLFVTVDEDLTGFFVGGCCSGPGPIRIESFSRGVFEDVTRQYPDRIEKDAWGFWSTVKYAPQHTRGDVERVLLVSYLADKCLLGQADDGWRQAKMLYKGGDWPAFAASARKALESQRYAVITEQHGAGHRS